MTQPTSAIAANSSLFKLEYPQSVGIFDSYVEAQKAVDHLADNNFPVANLAIVGTDLKLMERVTGRRTWGTVLGQGVMSGLSTGFIVAIFMMILFPSANFLGQLLTALVIGVVIGLLFAVLGYVLTRGQRDFTSVTQTIATKYEILCEHKVVQQARELLAKAPGAQARAFNAPPQPPAPGAWPQGAGYPPQPGPQGQPPQPWGAPGGYPQGGWPQQPYGQQPYPGTPPYGQQQRGGATAAGWASGQESSAQGDYAEGPYRPPTDAAASEDTSTDPRAGEPPVPEDPDRRP